MIVVGLAGFAGCGGGGGAGARDAGTGGSAGAGGSAGSSGGAGSNGGAGTGGAAGGGGQSTTGAAGADGGAADTVTGVDGGCSAIVQQHPDEGAQHLMTCSDPVTYHTVPPSSGNHYGVWANFRTYTMPVSWKNLVHSLEHGAVVIVYNCPGGCPEEVAQAQAFIDALPADPLCTLPAVRRVILAPDPTLDVRWAASAWTWTLRAPCFQQEAFAKFVSDHYAKAGEDTCYEPPQMMCPL